MRRVQSARALKQRGLEGDRHAARRKGGKRQVLLLEARAHAELRVPPGALKENLVVDGVPLESLPVGQRLLVGADVVLEVTGECEPCRKLKALRPGLMAESERRRGQLARVLVGGTVQEGDVVLPLP
ncbi:MAG: MOSC domain-containing protein [Deltaproteobacteria bacterium]|nr:MOSC domain-containing protein [Deltaproteobacteria bacterium]